MLTGSATETAVRAAEGDSRRVGSQGRFALGAAVVVASWVVVCGEAVPLLSTLKLQQSQAAVNAGRGPEALRDALAAKELEPWASTPRLQLALIEEQAGNLAAARKQIHEATRRNPHDWQLWLTASRIELKSGDVASAQRALVRARRLNPLSPVFTATVASQP